MRTLAGILIALACATPAQAQTFATTPAADRPEGLLVAGDTVFVSTTSGAGDLPLGRGRPSVIHLFDRGTGAPAGVIELAGERTRGSFLVHGIQGAAGMAMDARGRVYVADGQGRVLRLRRRAGGWAQSTYATIPDLVPGALSLTNEIEFAPDGSLFVTDSFQAAVFRVPPGGGTARVHLASERLRGKVIGPNGIALAPDGRSFYLAVTQADATASKLYALGMRAPDLRELATVPGAAMDGLALAASGRVYAAFSGSGEVGVFSPEGVLERRLPVPDAQEPAGIAFDPGTESVLVANHAFAALDDRPRTVVRVPVGEEGAERVRPRAVRGRNKP